MVRLKTGLIFLAALLVLWAPAAQAGPSEVLEAKWLPSADAFAQGKTYPLALRLTVKPGLHINANDPGDPDIIPTKIQFTAPKGLTLAPASYPPAKKIKLGFAQKPLAVFDGAMLVRTTLQVAGNVKPGDYQLKAEISFQGCDDNMCFMPESREVLLRVKVAPAGQKVAPLNRDLFAR
jgi:DsbC/DsbD-like thiol-disulfide interchange protein